MGLKYYYSRKCALVLAILMLLDALHPAMALALTSGPSQPEVQGFKPIEATNMVDLFTGDFNYNLPLFEIDGYPVNMSYNTNSRMEDESSWVGMGWTLNPGSVNREVRGFPDDFKDEEIVKKYNFKADTTIGITAGADAELFGLKGFNIGQGFFWNNKKGYGSSTSYTTGTPLGTINATYNTQSGLDLSLSRGMSQDIKKLQIGVNASGNINSRQGLRAIDFGMSLKEKAGPKNIQGSVQYELGGFTYFPTNPMPMLNSSLTFHGRLGFEGVGFHPATNLDGYRVFQSLSTKQQIQKAFGYLYHYEGLKNGRNLIDCNRDNQLVYREGMPSLPVSYGTYDNFTVAGQGVGGQFRLYKNDVGILHNGYASNSSSAGKLGVEIGGLPNAFHGGIDIAVTNVDSKSQIWEDNNKTKNVMPFTDSDSLYERAYFKDASERMVDDDVYNAKIGGTNPTYVQLTNNKLTPIAERTLQIEKNKISIGSNPVSTVLKKTVRGKRSNVMSYLTAAEAAKFGLDKDVKTYNFNQLYYGTGACQSPTSVSPSLYKPHHIREITINKPDGSRYVFGLPAYNLRQKEVSFSVSKDTPTVDGQAFINYKGTDTTSSNANGRDNFVENQSIPPHAHAYLLTGVLSDDYVDVKNDGITDDDLGNAVKFNYSKQPDNYKWRTPYSANKARLMQGMKTDKLDDKANYVFGEKEIWYVHSIESRNMVAQFYVSGNDANRRRDGFGVLGEQGGIDSSFNQGLRKLDSIKIFSKSDLLKNGVNAIPIKQVNFEYNYDICTNSFSSSYANGTGGKLTLKKVYFTFGNNGKGKLNAYKFTYKIKNPVTSVALAYDTLKVDRWGFYKQHPAGYPSYTDYPYSLQDSALTNQTAGAWNMDSIFLPSGGRIAIDYESDDYAYVQNKRAGQMFFIKGFAQDTAAINFVAGSPNANSLYVIPPLPPYGNVTNSKFIVIDVSAYSSLLNNAANPISEAVKLFFEDVKDVYFKAKVRLTTDVKTMEYITGYATCDKSLVHYNGVTKNLFVPISSVSESGFPVNPITLAALQTLRLNLPDVAYDFAGRSDAVNTDSKDGFKKVLVGLLGFKQAVSDIINNYTKNRVKLHWAKNVDVSNSWVRLANPTYKKFGGGSRVKKISVFDNWTITNGGGESNYTQGFSYTTNLNGKVISSGVASYEPAIGGDEISLKQPLSYQEKVKLAPDNSYYAETPIGESFYPGAGVGYSEVRVESVYPNVKRSGTGYTLNKFYTAKDFPTISDYTNIVAGSVKVKPSVISKLFKFNVVDQRGVSQGFSIETNDMHGKAKEEAVYNQQGALISATNYEYKVDDKNATTFHLNNDVQVVDPSGSISTRKMGVETDVWEEMQDEYVNTETFGVAINTDAFVLFIFPIPAFTPIPMFQHEKKGLKTAITTKHIRRMGMLDKVTKTVDGSTLTTNNMLYDAETGDVLLTQTENEFNDPIYNFTYPAHWAYDGMGPAYKNIGSIFKGIQFQGYGNFTSSSLPNPATYFVPGDELSLFNETTGQFEAEKYFIIKETNSSTMAIYDKLGNPFIGTSKYTVKIIRSGRRNKSSTPIGSIASLASPISAGAISINANTKVIQAESREFTDSWLMNCTKIRSIVDPTRDSLIIDNIINPYITELRGNWRGVKNFVHYNSRNIKNIPTSTDIRRDGYIPNFAPYWTNSSNIWVSAPSSSWVLSDSINLYNTRGNEIESYDANNIPSSAYYGYNGTQVAAVTSNSASREMTFDSFEDYLFKNSCGNDTSYQYDKNIRFFDPSSLTPNGTKNILDWSIVDSAAHTGKYSLRLGSTAEYFAGSLLQSNYCPTSCPSCKTQSNAAAKSGGTTTSGGTFTQCEDCLPLFSLDINKKYVLSYWIANDSSLTCNAIPQNISIGLLSGNAPITLNKVSTSPVIDGWQKVEVSFTANGSAADLTFKLSNQSTKSCYFDDIRVLPYNAKMKSYVYDIYSRRLMAELDENNYATFYEYDDEGILVRIKRETETGIQTVKEARNFLKPNN